MGISGANFGVVETGTICLVTNEGNGRMVTTLPRVHVALMGIEKLVPTLADLDRCLKVLARSATGQKLTVYTTLVRGPRGRATTDGPEELHVVLLDNGRSADPRRRDGGDPRLHPLRRVPERLPGLPHHRRPRVRRHLSRVRSAPSSRRGCAA